MAGFAVHLPRRLLEVPVGSVRCVFLRVGVYRAHKGHLWQRACSQLAECFVGVLSWCWSLGCGCLCIGQAVPGPALGLPFYFSCERAVQGSPLHSLFSEIEEHGLQIGRRALRFTFRFLIPFDFLLDQYSDLFCVVGLQTCHTETSDFTTRLTRLHYAIQSV